jgi:hypothetical protein
MPEYNRKMLTFQDFQCYPTIIPTIYPNGDLLYPCEVLNRKRYNLLKTESIKKAYKLGQNELGSELNCPGECFLPAFICTSCFIQEPFSAISQSIKLRMGNCYNIDTIRDQSKSTEYKNNNKKINKNIDDLQIT